MLKPKMVSGYIEAGQVAAALMTKSGNIYTGICIDTACSLGMCAERNAIAHMLTCGESEIRKLAVVMSDGTMSLPCGACCEFMMQLGQWAGEIEILERLTNTQMIAAEKKGCIVLSYSSAKQVWIDNAINTLITPADNQDDGWKKIRRVKTRFELIRRMNAAADALVGKVDNDKDGRSTVVSQLQAIGDNMIAEGKLTAITVSESAVNVADGDSTWFDIDVVDKDSMEHIYLSYRFQFSTNA